MEGKEDMLQPIKEMLELEMSHDSTNKRNLVVRQKLHQLQDCVHKRNVTSQEISDTILDMVSSFDGVPVT